MSKYAMVLLRLIIDAISAFLKAIELHTTPGVLQQSKGLNTHVTQTVLIFPKKKHPWTFQLSKVSALNCYKLLYIYCCNMSVILSFSINTFDLILFTH